MRIVTNRGLQWTTTIFLFVYAVLFVLGHQQRQLMLYLSVTNALTSLLAIAFFLWRKYRVPAPYPIDRRETFFLLTEGLFAAGALCSLAGLSANSWLGIVQYIVFAFHALAALLFLVFICTFRIRKLF